MKTLRLVSDLGFCYFVLGQKYMYELTVNREVHPTPQIVRRFDVYKVLYKSRPYIPVFRGHYRRGDHIRDPISRMYFNQVWEVALRKNGDTRVGCILISKSQLKIIARWSRQSWAN